MLLTCIPDVLGSNLARDTIKLRHGRITPYPFQSINYHPVSDNYTCIQIFWEAAGLERGPLSLVRTTDELLEAAPVKKTETINRGNPFRWPRDTLYPQKLALASPTIGGRSIWFARGPKPRRLVLYIYFSSPPWILLVPIHLKLLNLTTLIIFGAEYKLRSSSFHNFPSRNYTMLGIHTADLKCTEDYVLKACWMVGSWSIVLTDVDHVRSCIMKEAACVERRLINSIIVVNRWPS
jgi:hypothetical protein